MKDCDRLSLVTYDTNVRVQFGLTKMDDEQKEKTKTAVKALQSGSSTNLSGGLFEGMQTIVCYNGSSSYKGVTLEQLTTEYTQIIVCTVEPVYT